MNPQRRLLSLPLLALLGACEMQIGDGQQGKARTEQVASAEGKAEDGSISIDAPGFDMKLNIPQALRTEMGGDEDILYPGSKLGGLHVQAGENKGGGQGSVELRFTSADAPAKVAAWYRDPAQAKELTVTSAQQQGQGYRIVGTSKGGSDPFTLTLTPAGGGTEGRIVLQDRKSR
nr:hypothetical protein [uncultured Sphingosinicella sp.]